MTDELTRTEQMLRTVLTARAAEIPPVDLHASVVRGARRRRAALVAAGVGAALVAAGVPAALATTRTAPPPSSVVRPVPDPYPCPRAVGRPWNDPRLPVQRDVAGSLGGDPAAVKAVAQAAWGTMSSYKPELDPAHVRVYVAHQAEDGWIVGLATGTDRTEHALMDVPVVGPDLDHLSGLTNGWVEDGTPQRQRFTRGDTYAGVVDCGPPRALVVGPPGSEGEARWTAGIAADATVDLRRQPMTLRPDGFAVATLSVPSSAVVGVRVVRDGRVLASDVLYGRDVPKEPAMAEMRRRTLSAPGNADKKLASGILSSQHPTVPVPQHDVRVLWAGQGGGTTVAVAVSTLPSGAQYLWGGLLTWDDGQSGVEPFTGVVAAGALDRAAYTVQSSPGVVPPGTSRPLAVFFTGTRQVDVTSGGRTRTSTVTGGVVVDPGATVVVHGPDGTPLPLVDVRSELVQLDDPMQ
jgi:hypothetical protein